MRNQEISIQAQVEKLTTAIGEITQHNDQLNFGAKFGRFVSDQIRNPEIPEIGDLFNEASRGNSVKANIQEIVNCHRTNLERIGLGVVVEDDSSIRLVIADLDRVTSFVARIPPGTEHAETMNELAKTIPPVVRSLVEIDQVEDVVNILGDIKFLCNLFPRRGAGESIEEAFTLVSATIGGYLKEQIIVDSSGLLKEASFGPADWHRDSTASDLYKRWNNALSTLREIKKNDDAELLTDKVRAILEAGLDSLERDIGTWRQTKFPYSQGSLSQYEGVARLVRRDFDELMATS